MLSAVSNVITYIFKCLVSKMNGLTIGDIRYVKASPFIVGDIYHFLPVECWTKNDRNSLRYCANKQKWNGFNWVFLERVELTQSEWKEILT